MSEIQFEDISEETNTIDNQSNSVLEEQQPATSSATSFTPTFSGNINNNNTNTTANNNNAIGGGIETQEESSMTQFHFCRCKAEWFVKDGLGITCSVMTYCLIIFAEFVVIGVILLPSFTLSVWSFVHAIFFSLLAFLAACSHLRAMTTNPVNIVLLFLFFILSLFYSYK